MAREVSKALLIQLSRKPRRQARWSFCRCRVDVRGFSRDDSCGGEDPGQFPGCGIPGAQVLEVSRGGGDVWWGSVAWDGGSWFVEGGGQRPRRSLSSPRGREARMVVRAVLSELSELGFSDPGWAARQRRRASRVAPQRTTVHRWNQRSPELAKRTAEKRRPLGWGVDFRPERGGRNGRFSGAVFEFAPPAGVWGRLRGCVGKASKGRDGGRAVARKARCGETLTAL